MATPLTDENIIAEAKRMKDGGVKDEDIGAFITKAKEAQSSGGARRFVPEIVGGTPEQVKQQTARNLQGELGLAEPVSVDETVPSTKRFVSGFAPTPKETQAYYESEYGKGSFLPISADRALVRITGKDGKPTWVLDDPVGWDRGDIAAAASKAPQLVTGLVAALATKPGVQGTLAKAAIVSGASAIAANSVGAIQDIGYRALFEPKVDLPEILLRRGLDTAVETAASTFLPQGADKFRVWMKTNKAAKEFMTPFREAADSATEHLKKFGFNPTTGQQLGSQIQLSSPAMSVDDAGNAIAKALTDIDNSMIGESQRAIAKATENAGMRGQAALAAASGATAPVTPIPAGEATIGGMKKFFSNAADRVNVLYDDAIKTIADEVGGEGSGARFIDLSNTRSTINSMLDKLVVREVKTDAGTSLEPIRSFEPLLKSIREIEEGATVPQSLAAIRTLRTRIGEKLAGKSDDMFPGLGHGQAKELYKALSTDIDTSLKALKGDGGVKLRLADSEYKRMIEPTHTNDFVSKIVNDGFSHPEDVVARLANLKSEDWNAAKAFLGSHSPTTYNNLRRAVYDHLISGSETEIAGKKVADIAKLANSTRAVDPAIKTELFGSVSAWKSIEKIGEEIDFLHAQRGLFTTPTLPSLDALDVVKSRAVESGFSAANKYLKEALDVADKRRALFTKSLRDQIKNGTTDYVSANPTKLLDTIVFNGDLSPAIAKNVINELPMDVKSKVADAAFQSLWERSKDVAQNVVGKASKGTSISYNFEKMAGQIWGKEGRAEMIEHVIGPERFKLVESWTNYMVKLAMEEAVKTRSGHSVTSLISVAPYHNLFAARATAMAMSKASGAAFVASADPAAAKLFAEARAIMNHPKKSATAMTLIERATADARFGNYLDMLNGLSPEQQDAIDEYLTGVPRRPATMPKQEEPQKPLSSLDMSRFQNGKRYKDPESGQIRIFSNGQFLPT